MKLTVRRGAAAIAAALALTVTPVVATTITSASAADGGFSAVTTLPADVTINDILSVREGEVYVAGHSDVYGSVLYRYRDGTLTQVPFTGYPANTGYARLAAFGDRVFLMATESAYGYTSGYLFEIDGTTATQVMLPNLLPGVDPALNQTVTKGGIFTGDSTGIWVGAKSDGQTGALHWDGTTWTATSLLPGVGLAASPSVAVDGVLTSPFSQSTTQPLYRWDGTTWTPIPGGADATHTTTAYTAVSGTDVTAWGWAGQNLTTAPLVAPTGTCTHIVDTTATPCPAPAWPVTAAVRLSDGRVVLGGWDGDPTNPAAVPGGFAVVASPDAAPTDIAGDNGTKVVDLTAAPGSTTVWAVTQDGATYTLQSASLATGSSTPTPTPTTPTPTTTPTSTPTVTPSPDPTTPAPGRTRGKGPKTPKPTPTKTKTKGLHA